MRNKKISVVGLGYIGLPTAALLAHNNYDVVGIDTNSSVVDTINKGKIHIIEPDLNELVNQVVKNKKLKASLTNSQNDIFIICVPTPVDFKNKIPKPNIDYVLKATKEIAKFVRPGDYIILESTSPVGTTNKILNTLKEDGIDTDKLFIAYCPERVLPGKILHELVFNDRIIGGINPQSTEKIAEFYETFVKGKVYKTDSKTAEMSKLVENSFRDVNIAFANEISIICDEEGIDTKELISLANKHPRIDILEPGVGVGGHCIAIDPWFIVSGDNFNSKLIQAARNVNNQKTEWVIKKIKNSLNHQIKNNKKDLNIICLGLSYKPDIDDLRNSPALKICQKLAQDGYNLKVVEPNINFYKDLNLIDLDTAIKTGDVFITLVRHKEFIDAATNDYFKNLNIIDFCGLVQKFDD